MTGIPTLATGRLVLRTPRVAALRPHSLEAELARLPFAKAPGKGHAFEAAPDSVRARALTSAGSRR